MKTRSFCLPIALLFLIIHDAAAQGSAFTYQGRLNDGASVANGNYDLRFDLRDAATNGSSVGTANIIAPVAISNGLFTVTLDFGGSAFDGNLRWLEIGVRTNGSVAAHSILSPRQAVTSAPYAIYATTANYANSAAASGFANSAASAGFANSASSASSASTASTAGTASNVVNGVVVKSLNGLRDNVVLAAGSNVTITPSGNTLTIASTATATGSNGVWSLNGVNAYYNGGPVGIGTTIPASTLEVRGGLTLEAGGDAGLFTGTGSLELNRYLFVLNSAAFQSASGLKVGGLLVSDFYGFASPGKNDLIVKGRIGIGTPSPGNKLTVLASGHGIEHTDGTVRLGSYVDGTGGWLGTISNNKLKFFVNDGLASMTLDTTGNFGIGTTAPAADNKLEVAGNTRVNGQLRVNHPGSGGSQYTLVVQARPVDTIPFRVSDSSDNPVFAVLLGSPNSLYMYGDAYKNSGGTTWITFSDRRLKQNVKEYEPGLNEVLKLRPVRFHYRDNTKLGLTSTHEEVGFLAQEVREVIPDAVSEGQDGYLRLKADPIHWAAINAIQELNKKLEQKHAKVQELKKDVAELKEMVAKLAEKR